MSRPGIQPGAAVILAAGAGRRLGGVAKALLRRGDGTTFLAAVRDAALAAGVNRMVVVIGAPHDDVTRAEARRLDLDTVDNPTPQAGMASSVAVGFGHARRHFGGCAGALLWPVDHAAVSPATVREILARVTPRVAVIPTHRDRGGHPTGFGSDLWQDLESCVSAPQGARSVIRELGRAWPERVIRIAVEDAGVLADVDSPAQLEGPL